MEDLFKKFLYTGIGLVSLTREKLQNSIDDLVTNRKISREEGRKIVDDLMQKTESKRGEFESQLKKVTEEVLGKFNFAKAKELEELKQRVASLELKLGRVKTTAEAATVNDPQISNATTVEPKPDTSTKKPTKKPAKS